MSDILVKKHKSNSKDYSRYSFNDQIYSKSRLVLAVVEKYVSDHLGVDFNGLRKAFPDEIQGKKCVVNLIQEISEKDKGIGGKKRFFTDSPISLSSGDTILVSCEWCAKGDEPKDKSYGNIDRFIDRVKELGYSITKLDQPQS